MVELANKIGFEQNELFPELSNDVRVGEDVKRGKYIEAIRDIPPGRVLCLDTGVTVNVDDEVCGSCLLKKEKCHGCLAIEELKPFSKVLKTLGLADLASHIMVNYPTDQLVQLSRPRINEGWSSSDAKSIWALGKGVALDFSPLDGFLKQLSEYMCKNHDGWKNYSDEDFKKVFYEITSRLTVTAHTVYSIEKLCKSRDSEVPCGVGLFPVASLFNHSCKANVFSFFIGNTFVFVSKGVRKGEELVDDYGVQASTSSLLDRQKFLQGRGFKCKCNECSTHHQGNVLHDSQQEEEQKDQLVQRADEISARLLERMIEENEVLSMMQELEENERARGILFEPQQVKQFLLASASLKDNTTELSTWLFQALLRIKTFYKDLHPAKELSELLFRFTFDKTPDQYEIFNKFKQFVFCLYDV